MSSPRPFTHVSFNVLNFSACIHADRLKFVHRNCEAAGADDDDTMRGAVSGDLPSNGWHLKVAFRASLLKLHRQVMCFLGKH